jgi:hypothetical protein
MITMLFLAVLAGLGVHAIALNRRRSGLIAVLVGALFLIEAWAAPIPINRVGPGGTSVLRPPRRARTGDDIPPVYRVVATLPPDAVLIELPFGFPSHESQYVYYSTVHWRKLVNGYSGWRPRSYRVNQRRLARIPERPGRSWQALMDSGATHLIVHEGSFARGRGAEISAWLVGQGARDMGMWEEDRLFELPPRVLKNGRF